VSLTKSKTCGDYVNSILAKREVTRLGYDEAIMLDTNGLVAECSGEKSHRAPRAAFDRRSCRCSRHHARLVIRIARDKGIEVVEQSITRDEVYCAEEMFLRHRGRDHTGARGDDRKIGAGSRGPVTKTSRAPSRGRQRPRPQVRILVDPRLVPVRDRRETAPRGPP